MKKIKTPLLLALSLLVGCDALRSVSDNTVVSQGAPYELIVVANQPQWDGILGDSLRSVLTAPIPYLQQTEPIFDLLRVTESSYNNLVSRHRNILRTVVNPALESASVGVQYNLHATPQVVLTLQGPNDEALTSYLSEHRDKIVSVIEGAERDRAVEYAQRFGVASLEQKIEDKFKFSMNVPKGYTLRNEGSDFLWMSYEYPTSSQGVLIYSYPATKGAKSLSLEDLLAARNRYAAKIPGPSDGSYMSTYEEFTPEYRTFRLEGRLWAEMRGLWMVKGDFMGGPFVSFSTINTSTGEVVTIDCYVYSPKLGKRNFLRGVEQFIYNVSF